MRAYAFHLYYPCDQVSQALREVARWADVPWVKRSTLKVAGTVIEVPFTATHNFQAETVALPDDDCTFNTSLWMPKDKCLRDRLQWDMETRKSPRGEEARVGYIYLQLRLDTLYCEFAFIAAVKSMSTYFEKSVAVQKRFLQYAPHPNHC